MNRGVLSPWGSCLVPCSLALKSTHSVTDIILMTTKPNMPLQTEECV